MDNIKRGFEADRQLISDESGSLELNLMKISGPVLRLAVRSGKGRIRSKQTIAAGTWTQPPTLNQTSPMFCTYI